ncbi:hypothetical protein OF83DRAFT_37124 [Amylostereum chailletii]|nr:hypothetical protein OF83DRAFT_37124 [Amylostereum chailletii]
MAVFQSLPALPDLPAYPTLLVLATFVAVLTFTVRSRATQTIASPSPPVGGALLPTYGATTVTLNAHASVFKPPFTSPTSVENARAPPTDDTDSERTTYTDTSPAPDSPVGTSSSSDLRHNAVDPKMPVAHRETYVDDVSFNLTSQAVDNPSKPAIPVLNARAPVFRPRKSVSPVSDDAESMARAEALRTRADEIYNAGKNEAQKLNDEASRLIYETKNKNSKPGWVDLHGLYATEAVEYAGKGLETARKARVRQVKFIVGGFILSTTRPK